MNKELNTTIENHREKWKKTAKKHKWYKKPFYITVWIDEDNNILDSLSTVSHDKDYLVYTTEEEYYSTSE